MADAAAATKNFAGGLIKLFPLVASVTMGLALFGGAGPEIWAGVKSVFSGAAGAAGAAGATKAAAASAAATPGIALPAGSEIGSAIIDGATPTLGG